MTVNVGTFDRIARVVVGLALIAFALGWIGVVPILTAIFGYCPAYTVVGCSTK